MNTKRNTKSGGNMRSDHGSTKWEKRQKEKGRWPRRWPVRGPQSESKDKTQRYEPLSHRVQEWKDKGKEIMPMLIALIKPKTKKERNIYGCEAPPGAGERGGAHPNCKRMPMYCPSLRSLQSNQNPWWKERDQNYREQNAKLCQYIMGCMTEEPIKLRMKAT